ncbi:NUDIX hydrolase [Streptococcus catagoni]|uniref:NUDIX hydrolase n=1 Tax=Streptococcus catagoni TaxID=2654874 RepID=UPI001F2888CB|nr:NUDIX domain-containing protein [Streptococcus catagoni]
MVEDFRLVIKDKVMEVRSSLLLVKNQHVLLVKDQDIYYTVGGAVQFGELSHEAVSRETTEELGIGISNKQLAFVVENHFTSGQQKWHNIEFHYFAEAETSPPLQMLENKELRQCEWVAFSQLK